MVRDDVAKRNFMSISTQNRVWDHSQQDGTNLIAMLALADWSDADGICWYANDKIAQKVRREERTVTRILNKLRESGEVFAPPEFGAGRKTLKFITIGLTEIQLIDVLTRRFGMTPIVATEAALKIIKAQKEWDKPVISSNKPVIGGNKPVTDDTFFEDKPVTGDGNKPVISGNKPVTGGNKPVIAMSPDPSDTLNDPSDDPTNNPPPPSSKKIHVLDQLDPKRPFDDRALAIAAVCGMNTSVPRHREQCDQAASQIHTYSGDIVRKRYGDLPPPDGWHWYRDDWRGQRGDAPTPKQVVETIAKRRPAQKKANSAGDRLSRSEQVAADYAALKQGFFNER